MARIDCEILDTGAPFPRLDFRVIGDESVSFPRDLEGRWTVLMFYRGHW